MIQPSGIYLLNKPKGITSNDLIQKVKRKFNVKKIGHAGTLDPLATGLMIVLINQATKISNYLLSSDKCYEVTMKLFIDTDTKDITGKVLKEEEPFKIGKSDLKNAIDKYNGYMYDQYPPIYSAIKVKGKKLYEYARENKEEQVEIKSRTVTINKCELIEYNQKENTIKLKVDCSKGTYIRSLVTDIANDLGTIATVIDLERTKSGEFLLENAKTIEDIKESDYLSIYDALILNKHTLIEYHLERDIKQGKPINLLNNDPIAFIVNDKKEVIAIYKHVAQDLYVCQRGLWVEDPLSILTEAEKEGY